MEADQTIGRPLTLTKPELLDLLPKQGEQVLLINPSVYDTRLHWAAWLQPLTLLQLVSYSRSVEAEAKFIDMLHHQPRVALRRQRVDKLSIDDLTVNKWRFGLAARTLQSHIRQLSVEGHEASTVYLHCFTTFWWEGAAEAVAIVRQCLPHARIVIVGAYASLAPLHAVDVMHADGVLTSVPQTLHDQFYDLSQYPSSPGFAYISLASKNRSAYEIVDDIAEKVKDARIMRFAFADHNPIGKYGELFRAVLLEIVARHLRINLHALGTIAPSDIADDLELVALMRDAGYAQIFFSDDRAVSPAQDSKEQWLIDHQRAVHLLHTVGFPQRTDAISASLSIGRSGESLDERARAATLLAHHVGSVILVPYQPTPGECPELPLEQQNGKLFPFREQNGYTYRDYLDVMGLAVVLNAKYRTKTFDFLGEGMVARLFRDSLERRAWKPDPEVKGTLRLPLLRS